MRLWALARVAAAAASLVACVATCLVACESEEPDPTPLSRFAGEDPFSRLIVGRVSQGLEPVEGALVQVDPSSALASDLATSAVVPFARNASTDASGFYRILFAPFIYDLSIRRERELFVFRSVAVRYYEPSLGSDEPVSGYRARLIPTTSPPPAVGNAVAYFVSGPDARAMSRDAGSLEVAFRRFDTTVTLHAIEYVANDGLVNAVSQGKVDVRVGEGLAASPQVVMTPIAGKPVMTFEAVPPAGYALAPLEVFVDFGLRSTALPVARVTAGAPLTIGVAFEARYSVRARATVIANGAAAVSDSGETYFNAFGTTLKLVLPPPISAEAPVDDDAAPGGPAASTLTPAFLDPGGVLSARFERGTLEHVLTPLSGDASTIRIVTAARETTLPDATRFGLPRPTGRYTWTTRHFATLPFVDRLSGDSARTISPTWTSAPRPIVLR